MSELDREYVPLSVTEILELAELVDNERERIRRMIKELPSSTDNQKRRDYIFRLDGLSEALMADNR